MRMLYTATIEYIIYNQPSSIQSTKHDDVVYNQPNIEYIQSTKHENIVYNQPNIEYILYNQPNTSIS
jgi:hypothetical protein